MSARGQISGHPGWDTWLEGLVREHGSWTALAERLVAARGHHDELASVERALRRLRGRGALSGGVWGRRLLAAFGPPADVTARLRFMGSYHSRFVDLPVPLCADLLRLWDRPPASESRDGRAWLALARGSLALRERRYDDAASAFAAVRTDDPHAIAEAALGAGILATRADPTALPPALDAAEGAIARVTGPDHANLAARLVGQRAWVLNRRGETERAEALHRALPAGPDVPAFARARRENGLAYARHAAGDPVAALAHARASARAAGDAGHVRLRAMALLMIARVAAGTPEADDARARARRIAVDLEDAVLLGRAG